MYKLKPKYIFKNFIGTLTNLLISILITSCAQVVAPGGGPRDKTPPQVVKYTPDSAQLHFNSRSIEITFDEYIQLRDLNSQLIISPPLVSTPDITVKGKSLFIELDKKEILKPNTTYAINFGGALQDFNENNPKENFKYVFSTGDYIDSLSVTGTVQNAFDLRAEKGVIAMLYSDLTDSAVYKKQPDYFARTSANGNFQITNVKEGKYKLVAVRDLNSNYKYDGESENIGFITEPITITKKKNYPIYLFQESPKKIYLKKYTHDQYGKITFIFNQPIQSLTIDPLNHKFNDEDILFDFSPQYDTLHFWFRNVNKDSLKLQLRNNKTIIDTVEFKLIKKEEALKSKKNPFKLKLIGSPNGNQNFDLNAELKLTFNHPITIVNKSGPVMLKADSILQKEYRHLNYFNEFTNVKIQWTDTVDQAESSGIAKSAAIFNPKFLENTKYHLIIPPGTFTDFFGFTNDSIKMEFKTREEKYYGNVKLKVSIAEAKGNKIVQLLDEKENVIREDNVSGAATLSYPYLYPLKYRLKIIYDVNNNGKWDSGNYLQKKQPEKIIYYKEPINIRSNWDMDLEWNLTPSPSPNGEGN